MCLHQVAAAELVVAAMTEAVEARASRVAEAHPTAAVVLVAAQLLVQGQAVCRLKYAAVADRPRVAMHREQYVQPMGQKTVRAGQM